MSADSYFSTSLRSQIDSCQTEPEINFMLRNFYILTFPLNPKKAVCLRTRGRAAFLSGIESGLSQTEIYKTGTKQPN